MRRRVIVNAFSRFSMLNQYENALAYICVLFFELLHGSREAGKQGSRESPRGNIRSQEKPGEWGE